MVICSPYHHDKFTVAILVDKSLNLLEPVPFPHSPGTVVEGRDGNPECGWLEFLLSKIQDRKDKIAPISSPR